MKLVPTLVSIVLATQLTGIPSPKEELKKECIIHQYIIHAIVTYDKRTDELTIRETLNRAYMGCLEYTLPTKEESR